MGSRLVYRSFVTLAAIAGASAALEFSARAVTHALGRCHPVCITQYDSTLGWTNTPDAVGRHRISAWGVDVTYRIGRTGLRGRDISPKQAGLHRVVVLGDSNGFGWGVPDGREFAALVEQTLDRVEVLNLSVSGYGTDQELLRLRQEGPHLMPDFVVLQVTPNDLADIQRSMVGTRPKPYFSIDEKASLKLRNVPVTFEPADGWRLPGGFAPLGIRVWLARHSFFYVWMSDRIEPPASANQAIVGPPEDGARLFYRLVQEIAGTTLALGGQLVVLHASNNISRIADAVFPADTPVLDLSGHFAAAGTALFADGLHWNELGHRVAAEHLATWLSRH